MEIARAAAGLFVRQGLKATRAEDIAQAAGIAPRTFYRYFAAKEEAVAPLYEAGARRWVEAVRAAPPGTSVPQALEDAVRSTLGPGAGESSDSWMWVRTLVRLTHSTPSLRRVWAEVCQTSERALAEVLAARVRAGTATDDDAEHATRAAQVDGTSRVGGAGGAGGTGRVDSAAVDARLRFAAAVASAAVRAAVEGWAAGDGTGEDQPGPAELAVANLATLRDFPWDALTKS
ncbi:TetR/AcrR family transcriptional regulator [Streptomyces sp. NBC_01635]|uniref:TetR/AcrR family transcriptional regulator n=1 Tax=Streptomyces sp. NBC_01635 TaxID=2975904 RepID=UPI0038703739|nr:TetR/AcrR family transcriptional regulator [Streptomyces sp. NBC_01635]